MLGYEFPEEPLAPISYTFLVFSSTSTTSCVFRHHKLPIKGHMKIQIPSKSTPHCRKDTGNQGNLGNRKKIPNWQYRVKIKKALMTRTRFLFWYTGKPNKEKCRYHFRSNSSSIGLNEAQMQQWVGRLGGGHLSECERRKGLLLEKFCIKLHKKKKGIDYHLCHYKEGGTVCMYKDKKGAITQTVRWICFKQTI